MNSANVRTPNTTVWIPRIEINQTYGHGSGDSVEKTAGVESLGTEQSKAEQVSCTLSMNMKVFAVLLLFAASCELVANPSEGLKDVLHKLAVKNSGNRTLLNSQSYKATPPTF